MLTQSNEIDGSFKDFDPRTVTLASARGTRLPFCESVTVAEGRTLYEHH